MPNQDPAPGSVQPVGGFSALVDGGNGTLWAMPDNGFGSKANSRSFALRVYKARPRWKTKDGGPGTVESILPIDRNELAVVNDTNFGSTGRNPSLPDYSDFIEVKVTH